jgi:rod shape-determining protein MreB
MDEAIIQHMRKNYNLMIGEQTAERIKIEIGSACPLEEEAQMRVKGRDLLAGLPREALVGSEEIRDALKEPVESLLEAIKRTLEKTPPELAADLIDNGIVLAGGGALLKGLDRVIEMEVELPVTIADDALTAVARGTGVILEELEMLKAILDSADA